jgi:hypothetical protein
MTSISRMEDHDIIPGRMNRQVHRKIAQSHLASRGAKGPLIREQDRTVILDPGKLGLGQGTRRGIHRCGPDQKGAKEVSEWHELNPDAARSRCQVTFR